MRMLKSLTLGAAVAAWLTVTAVTAPGPELTGQAYPQRPAVQEDQPGWDCATMGNRVCGPVPTCWVEKASSPDTAEGICGPVDLRPADSVDLGSEVTVGGRTWVATMAGLEPVSAN